MSRVIIYLELLLPIASSDPPESRSGKSIAFFLVLLRMGFTCAPSVTRRAVVSYTAFPPLPKLAVYFCCTGLGVTSTGRYPASCPMKPGLSSPVKYSRDRLFSLHNYRFYHVYPRLSKIFISFLFVSLLQPIHAYFQYTISKNISLFETRHSFWR